MANMTAVYLPGDRRVDVRSVAVPEPGPDEVLIEIKASCICRSDLSLYYGNAVVGGEAAGRCITGHEPAGVVVKMGEAVTGFSEGDNVSVYLAIGCGLCAHCRQGNHHLCPTWKCIGFTADGGNAEFLKVPARNLLKTPSHMSHLAAAISTDAFGTLFSACEKSAPADFPALAYGVSDRWGRAASLLLAHWAAASWPWIRWRIGASLRLDWVPTSSSTHGTRRPPTKCVNSRAERGFPVPSTARAARRHTTWRSTHWRPLDNWP